MTETPPSVAETSIEQLRLHGQRLQLLANPYVVGLATAQVLTPEDLDVLRSIPGTVPADLVALLDVRLQQAVEEANTSFFRFDLRTLEAFHQLAYDACEGTLDGCDERKLTTAVANAVGDYKQRVDTLQAELDAK